MIRLDQPDQCAFCGRLIEPGEEKSGRGDAAAHVACADAALGDDRFWDRIAAGMGDASPAPPEPGESQTRSEPGDRPATSGGNADSGAKPGSGAKADSGAKAGSSAKSGCLLPAVLAALVVLVEATRSGRG